MNTVFVHSRYFWVYCDIGKIENEFRVPIFGTRGLVRKEERNEEKPMKKAVRETEEVAEVKEEKVVKKKVEKEDTDKEEAPKVEEKKHKEKMNQLNQKLEQLLSGGEDFNL